jgi:hypothetical protein
MGFGGRELVKVHFELSASFKTRKVHFGLSAGFIRG